MKKLIKISSLFLLMIFSLSLQAGEIKGNQQIAKETRQLTPFEQVIISSENISANMNVIISYAIQSGLEIEGESNLLEYLITEVKGAALTVKVAKKTKLVNSIPINLHITMPLIKKISYSGSGNVNMEGVMSEKMEVVLSGSGNFNLKNISVPSLKMNISGNFQLNCGEIIAENAIFNLSGNVNGSCMNLSAPKFKLMTSSTGKIVFHGLKSESSAELTASGTGQIEWTNFTGKVLKAVLSGSSEINITGSVKDVDLTASGACVFNATSLIAKKCKVVSSGTGSVYVAPTDNLDITLSGSGNLYYKGNPKIKIQNTGTGQLINKN